MDVSLFDFDLPDCFIAHRPASPRDQARMLVVGTDHLTDARICALPDWLRPGDLLVSNDTMVIPARLSGLRGLARISLTLHQQTGPAQWRAFAKPAKKLKIGDTIQFAPDFGATVTAKGDDGQVDLTFDRSGPDLMAALDRWGSLPLPPYIRKGQADQADSQDYQTIFASKRGAVAAPTAGLHFTPALLQALDAGGIDRMTVTLHVGAGTFLPVKVDDTDHHHMHTERGCITSDQATRINQAKAQGRRIVAVGTTSLRLLESAADACGMVHPFDGGTDIFITPGYQFRAADVLLTNFHLPRSTLFMLVSAFAGLDRMRQAYDHAKQTGYRFYSYGDACLLTRMPQP